MKYLSGPFFFLSCVQDRGDRRDRGDRLSMIRPIAAPAVSAGAAQIHFQAYYRKLPCTRAKLLIAPSVVEILCGNEICYDEFIVLNVSGFV